MNNNFNYSWVRCDYDRDRKNEWHIINEAVTYVEIDWVFNKVNKELNESKDPIVAYGIDVILKRNGAYLTSWYECIVGWGYYGQEIDSIEMNNFDKVVADISTLISMKSDIDTIKYILEYDYGYLIEKVENASSVKVENIETKMISTNEGYWPKITSEFLPIPGLPRWVVFSEGSGYHRLIDWYHRHEYARRNKEFNNTYIVLS